MKIAKIFIKLLSIATVLLTGVAVSFLIYQVSLVHQTESLDQKQAEIEAQYAKRISTETDAYKLTQDGLRQIKTNLDDMALASLQRATAVEKNYRDGWLALALAQIKTNNCSEALKSTLKAEELDPINPKTYELLALIYKKTNNPEMAQIAQKKLELLTKR